MDKGNELVQVQRKLESQEPEIYGHQQHTKELQQKYDDSKKAHELETAKSNKALSNNSKEIFKLKNHNKTLVMKIKKLKNSQKEEHSTKDIE